MRALLLSDIHANLEALDAVLNDASTHGGFDAIWCLGDTVGYGPDPGECIGRLRDFDLLAVAGNHDYAAVGKIDYNDFNGAAQESTIWTAEQLTGDEAEFLSALPLVAQMDRFTLVHGSLVDPLVEYLLDGYSANATLALLQTPLCLVGHSHLPFICRENDGAPLFVDFTEGAVTRWGETVDHQSRLCGTAQGSRPKTQLRHFGQRRRDPGAAARGIRHWVNPSQDAPCRITGVLGRPAQLRMLAGRSAVRSPN